MDIAGVLGLPDHEFRLIRGLCQAEECKRIQVYGVEMVRRSDDAVLARIPDISSYCGVVKRLLSLLCSGGFVSSITLGDIVDDFLD